LARGLQIVREAARSKGARMDPELGWADRLGPILAHLVAAFLDDASNAF
jgi:hypothetical protein